MSMLASALERLALGAALAVAGAAAGSAMAQEYPVRTVRIIVPFTPGGSTDISARLVAERLTTSLKQSVIVENRAGANGIIGAEAVARSAPDGYTMLLGNLGVIAINPAIRSSLSYNPRKDFVPVVMLAVSPLVLITHPASGIKSAADLVARAKAAPEKLAYSTGGIGSASHMAAELFNYLTGVRTTHVPYKGAAPATAAVAAGDVAYSFSGQGPSWPMVKAGRVLGVALTGAGRSSEHPETPTIKESGVANYETVDWFGLFLPAGAPRDIVTRLNVETNKILAATETRPTFLAQGLEPSSGSTEQFAAFIQAEQEKWDKVAKTANIRAE
jgi:tripartite-type tricarboxylate transporter receptor subunit TctC